MLLDTSSNSNFDLEILTNNMFYGVKVEQGNGQSDFYSITDNLTMLNLQPKDSALKIIIILGEEHGFHSIISAVDFNEINSSVSIILNGNDNSKLIPTEDIRKYTLNIKELNELDFMSFLSAANCNASNTSPLAPNLMQASLNGNMLGGQSAVASFSFLGKVLWFKDLVANNGVYDFKQHGSQFEEYGNYHYGALGASIGIPEQVLLRAAGWAQMQAGTTTDNWGHYLGSSPYGDDPADQAWIQKGINYYDNVFNNLNTSIQYSDADSCNEQNNQNLPSYNDRIDFLESIIMGGGGGYISPYTPILYEFPSNGHTDGWNCGSCHTGSITDL